MDYQSKKKLKKIVEEIIIKIEERKNVAAAKKIRILLWLIVVPIA